MLRIRRWMEKRRKEKEVEDEGEEGIENVGARSGREEMNEGGKGGGGGTEEEMEKEEVEVEVKHHCSYQQRNINVFQQIHLESC